MEKESINFERGPAVYPANGIIRIYNQFPRSYPGGIREMIQQLPLIREQGFNVVWINPIQLVGESVVVNRGGDKVRGSIYAIRSLDHFNPQFFPGIESHEERCELLRAYTKTAKSLGLIPIFDLVLNQVADEKDSPIVQQFGDLLAPKMVGREGAKKRSMDDTLFFNYDSEENRERLFGQLWRRHIDVYLKDLGFMGVRMDAVKHLNKEFLTHVCTYLHRSCQETYKQNAIIFGELLDFKPTKYVQKLMQCGITHILNNACHADFSPTKFVSWGQTNGWVSPNLSALKSICSSSEKEDLKIDGGTVGYVGNHDESPLIACAQKKMRDMKISPTDGLLAVMKQELFCVSMISDAGWYMLCGDEFGCSAKVSVFNDFRPTIGHLEKFGGKYNLCDTLRGINAILEAAPPSNQIREVRFCSLPNNPDVIIALRISQNDTAHVVVCNLSSKGFSPQVFSEIQDMVRSNTGKISCIHILDSDKLQQFDANFQRQSELALSSDMLGRAENTSSLSFEKKT